MSNGRREWDEVPLNTLPTPCIRIVTTLRHFQLSVRSGNLLFVLSSSFSRFSPRSPPPHVLSSLPDSPYSFSVSGSLPPSPSLPLSWPLPFPCLSSAAIATHKRIESLNLTSNLVSDRGVQVCDSRSLVQPPSASPSRPPNSYCVFSHPYDSPCVHPSQILPSHMRACRSNRH